ncbi:MAG: MFS transporter [Stackebrandtia sp.]
MNTAKTKYLPVLLITAIIGTIIELDMSVPSFPDIASDLKASESLVQLTITYNFLGYFLGALVYGPLSDRFGRRGVMLVGNSIMLLGALGCAVAPSIEFLLASRFVQGVGASTSVVLVFVIISDVYRGGQLFKMLGLTNAAMSILMTAAPALGGVINQTVGWRGNYAVVFAVTLIGLAFMAAFLPETKDELTKVTPKQVAVDYRRLLSNKEFVATSLVPSLLFAGYMVFIAASSFLYTETFDLSVVAFAAHLLVIVASFAVTSMFSAKLVTLLGGPQRTVFCGMTVLTVGISLFLAFGDGPVATTGTIVMFCVGFAAVYPVIFGRSMGVIPQLQGAAGSLNMGVRALLVTVFTGAASSLFTGDPVVTAGVMAVAVVVSVLLVLVTPKQVQPETEAEPEPVAEKEQA